MSKKSKKYKDYKEKASLEKAALEEAERPKLYINIDDSYYTGERNDPGDGKPYSGFNHQIIHVNSWGPAYFAKDGKGIGSHRVIFHYERHDCRSLKKESVPEGTKYLFFVIVRYGDGGTFGKTDGYYEFREVFLSHKEAHDYGCKYQKVFEEDHNGYFESYEGWKVVMVELVDEKDVEKKGW